MRWDLLDAFRKAAEEYGIKPIDDFNRGDNEGSAYFHVNQRRGRRWSAARGFLKPVLNRPNLRRRDRLPRRSASSSTAGARPACAGARTA